MKTSTDSSLVGVILAAGKGSRMEQLPTNLPKPILPILDKPIILYQLETMAEFGVKKAFVVVGHRGFEIVHMIERMPDTGIEIEYIDQEETLGIAHSLARLEPLIHSPFILFLGDIYFHAPKIGGLLEAFEQPNVSGVLGAIEEKDPAIIAKNFCIITDDSGRATRVIEKPRFPGSTLKGVGVYIFAPVVFDAIRRTPRTAMRNEYEITDSIQIMIDDGHHVRPCSSIEADLNVTNPADLLEANLRVLRYEELDSYVAPDASVPADVVLKNSVIGSKAVVGKGASITNSVLFSGVTVPEGIALDHAIVTEREIVRV